LPYIETKYNNYKDKAALKNFARIFQGLTTLTAQGVIMGTQQLTLPGEIVKKDNRLVRSKLNISSVDTSRILANLVACIHTDDKSLKRVYRVAVKDFLADTSGRGYTRVKGLCRELAQVTVELEEPDPDGPHPIFEIGTIFSRIVYKKGIVEAEFNGHMAPFLLDLQQMKKKRKN
jgi:plasmid replication initiation protein